MKKNIRTIVALLITLVLVASLFSACNNGENTSNTNKNNNTSNEEQSQNSDSNNHNNDEGQQNKDQNNSEETLPVRYVAPGNTWEDQDYVIGKVNEKLKSDGLNLEVELKRIPWDAWEQKSNLMLSTGEEFELIHIMQDIKTAALLRSQNAIRPINEIVDEYPELVDKLEPFWADFTVKDEILAVPVGSTRNISKNYGKIFYRKDIFDQTGESMPETVDGVIDLALDMKGIIEEEQGNKAYTWTHSLNRPFTWLHRTYSGAPFVVESNLGLVRVDQDGTVSSWYEHPDFKKDCDTYREMYKQGLVHPDILTLGNEDRANAGETGNFIFGFETMEYPSTEVPLKQNADSELADFWLNPELGSFIYFSIYNGNAVPTSAPNPESGIKFLNWLYSSQENYRLFTYGEEGRHYEQLGEYTAEFKKGENSNNLYKYDEWQMGFIDYRLFEEGITEKGLAVEQEPIKGKVVRSPILGFTFDQSNVENEMANLKTEIITSIYPIKFGLVDYESNIDQALQNLKAAGLDKVVDEYEKQFKDFLGE